MKGLIFVELLSMAETLLGEDAVDKVLNSTPLPSGGVYTNVGYYNCGELIQLVEAFSTLSGLARHKLERKFGHWAMDAFQSGYPQIFKKHKTAFDLLEAIEDDIHVEVRKLYPDAELPSFRTMRNGDTTLDLEYRSERPLVHFCHGLVESCLRKYEENAHIEMNDISQGEKGHARFRIDLIMEIDDD